MLWPPNLSSGPESGLCNQLYAFIGWVIKASYSTTSPRAIVLPNFTSHDHNGTQQIFADLFEPEAMAASLARVGIDVWWCPGTSGCRREGESLAVGPGGQRRMLSWRQTQLTHGGVLVGWYEYKKFARKRWQLVERLLLSRGGGAVPRLRADFRTSTKPLPAVPADRFAHPDARIEEAVYRGLRPAASIRKRVRDARRRLGLGGPASAGSASRAGTAGFGCVHARIEEDMRREWHLNGAGRPPSLQQILRGMARHPRLHAVRTVFVAVGTAITPADRETLDHGTTSWGAAMRRSTYLKATPWGQRGASAEPSYTEASLVDLEVCRAAEWLVGFSGSTFTRVLARLREVERHDGWVSACPSPSQTVAIPPNSSRQLTHWALCGPPPATTADTADAYRACSFGVCAGPGWGAPTRACTSHQGPCE